MEAALLLVPKASFDQVAEELVDWNSLINVRLADGRWHRRSKHIRDSYLFARLTEENQEQLLDYALRGGLPQFLAIDPLVLGHHNVPREFGGDLDAFLQALDRFRDQGVAVGIHTFLGQISPEDPSFLPPSTALTKFMVGGLGQPLSADATRLEMASSLAGNAVLADYLSKWGGSNQALLIDDELMVFSGNDDAGFDIVERGAFGTEAVEHGRYSEVYLVPHQGPRRFYVDPDNQDLVWDLSDAFADVLSRIHATMLYVDGSITALPPGMSSETNLMRGHGTFLTWLLWVLLQSGASLPLVQCGNGSPSFGWTYVRRVASWDGVVFRNKAFTRNHKVPVVARNNPYGAQSLVLELRPWFDFLDWDDPAHGMITDFSGAGSYQVTESTAQISCNLSDGGALNIVKQGSEPAWCVISLPGDLDMTYRRGVGLSLVGDNGGETVFLRVFDSGWGVRDFRAQVDFSGQRNLVLARATTDILDPVQGAMVTTSPEALRRSWDFDYGGHNFFSLRVAVAQPGAYHLQFLQAKVLQEKTDSRIVRPTIHVNGQSESFDLSLAMNDEDPHLLTYDGPQGFWASWTSNHQSLQVQSLSNVLTLAPGANRIEIALDCADPMASRRMDVRVTMYSDQPVWETTDQCPDDPNKMVPGQCGCGLPDEDANENGIVDCNEPVGAEVPIGCDIGNGWEWDAGYADGGASIGPRSGCGCRDGDAAGVTPILLFIFGLLGVVVRRRSFRRN